MPTPLSPDEMRALLSSGAYRLSDHALRQMVERNISDAMIREAARQAELIQDYP